MNTPRLMLTAAGTAALFLTGGEVVLYDRYGNIVQNGSPGHAGLS